MASTVNLEIQAKNTLGNSVKTTVTYVNPEATNEQLKLFAQKLNALTDNEYESATKVTKEVVI